MDWTKEHRRREIEKIEKNVEGEKLGSHDGCSHAVTAGEIRS